MAPSKKESKATDKKKGSDINLLIPANSFIGEEEIVITGMAGCFPKSDDIYQFRDNLRNKIDMTTDNRDRWPQRHSEIPPQGGFINLTQKFDAGFFGIQKHLGDALDPMGRRLLEHSFESILDSGYNLGQLRGMSVGVFIGLHCCESEIVSSQPVLGCMRSMLAQRISYSLGLDGPSLAVDTACSSSFNALECAYTAIKSGKCEAALVGAANLCLHPNLSLQLMRLGVLTMEGSSKPFDDDASGYIRAESIAVIFVQKSRDARRIYAQIIHAKVNCDGYKEQGITFPSSEMQTQVMKELYEECSIDPSTVDYVEAHATGTKVGDPEEINAIEEVFLKNRKKPLHVGSVKSNMGHSEPVSGLCSIIKVLLNMENNILLPGINYDKPRKGLESMERGKIVVVMEVTPWPEEGSGLVGLDNFGFGGTNAHILLKKWPKQKINRGTPTDDLPRLICTSGRTKNALEKIFEDVTKRPLDAEFVQLLHEIFGSEISGHRWHGYTVMSKKGLLKSSIQSSDQRYYPLCLTFGEPNNELLKVGKDLYDLPLFRASIERSDNILSLQGVDLKQIVKEANANDLASIVIGNIAIQIAIVEIVKAIGLSVDYLMGGTFTELVIAYADSALTLEQTLKSGFFIGTFLNKRDKMKGRFSKVSKIKNLSLTFSELFQKRKKVIKDMDESQLMDKLTKIMPNRKRRSTKWITSMPKGKEEATPKYFFQSLFHQPCVNTTEILPSQTILLEMNDLHIDLQNHVRINLFPKKEKNHLVSMLSAFGQLYLRGHTMHLEKLYPTNSWPVSASTPMISPLIKWNHSADWYTASFSSIKTPSPFQTVSISIEIGSANWKFLAGHMINGRVIMPGSAYFVMVWESFAKLMCEPMEEMPVVFENVNLLRITNIPKTGTLEFSVIIHHVTGKFEVEEMGQSIVNGRIFTPVKPVSESMMNLSKPPEEIDSITLSSRDIYQELKLRGYIHIDDFCGLKQVSSNGTHALVEWTGNWITFIDNLLQIKYLQINTRQLHILCGIKQMSIDPKAHLEQVTKSDGVLSAYVQKESQLIKSGGIEIRDWYNQYIPRRRETDRLLLQTLKFIPFETKLQMEQSIYCFMQLVAENNFTIKLRIIELIDEATQVKSAPLGPLIHQTLNELPFVQPEMIVLSEQQMYFENITVQNKKVSSETHSCAMIVVSKFFERTTSLQDDITNCLDANGFILSRENKSFESSPFDFQFAVIAIHETEDEKLVLLRTTIETTISKTIDLSDGTNFKWLSALQKSIRDNDSVLMYAQNSSSSGILGLFKSLRRETSQACISCLFVQDEQAPKFDVKNEFYSKQLKKRLAINVLKDGKWGTYKYLKLGKQDSGKQEHVVCNITAKGGLSSLQWYEGSLRSKLNGRLENKLVHVYYVAINYQDMLLVSGRISSEILTKDLTAEQNLIGFEFAGRDEFGKRVMGITSSGRALASMVKIESDLLMEIPDSISLKEAVTIPVAYATAIHALILTANIKHGESVLIHAGTGELGQAAIIIALYFKCNIFTTVKTRENREFIKKTFPEILSSHVGNFRDMSIEEMILKETNGRGVDIVFNSLSGEVLQASLRCLAPDGKFLEIVQGDQEINTTISFQNVIQGRSFHGITLDPYFKGTVSAKTMLCNLILEGLEKGYVKPLNMTVFNKDEVKEAFRLKTSGLYTGKIVVKLRDEEAELKTIPKRELFNGMLRFYSNPNSSYIIVGGLGGFGLELADWLILRGSRKLILVSRTGITNGYQAYRLRFWKKYGATIKISQADTTTQKGCTTLIKEAQEMGSIHGIFNAAAVVKDGLIENLNEENFTACFLPKAISIRNLDSVSREMCPELKYFVAFSSVVSELGNIGQTSYGMANSAMERICEKRRKEGYPALIIQWGALGEVGLLAHLQDFHRDVEIGGTNHQQVASCLELMDYFLHQPETIVSSIIVAKIINETQDKDNMLDTIKNILGIADLKMISCTSTFSELGMDSIMAVEVKQTLEKQFDVFLSAQEIRCLTFTRLQNIQENAPGPVK